MAFLKGYIKANSILESTVALAIISIGLTVAVKVCAMIFTETSSIKYYEGKNKNNELFFLAQTKSDSIFSNNEDLPEINIEEKSPNLKKISIYGNKNDSSEKLFYILTD